MFFKDFILSNLKVVNIIDLKYELCSLYFISRYKKIEVYNKVYVDNLETKRSYLLLLLDNNSKFKSIAVSSNDSVLSSSSQIETLTHYYDVSYEVSEHLKGNPNHYISGYDYFFKLTYENFTMMYFVNKVSKLNNKKNQVCPWYSAKINSYFNHLGEYFRVINITYNNILHTIYKSVEDEIGPEALDAENPLKDKNRFLDYKPTVFEPPVKHLCIVYDIETIPDLIKTKHYLFCLVATHFIAEAVGFDLDNIRVFNKDTLSQSLFECNLIEEINELTIDNLAFVQHKVGEMFTQYICKVINECQLENEWSEIKVHVIGFNNRNFDDHHIIDDFLRIITYYKRKYCKRELKVVSHLISTYSILKNKSIDISFDDVSIWLPEISSLKVACQELNIELGKLDFDIVKFNQYSLENGNVRLNFKLNDFFNFWKGNVNDVVYKFTRAQRKSTFFKDFESKFNDYFKLKCVDLNITNVDSLVSITPFITLYCKYDVFATAQLFITLFDNFNQCLYEVFEEFNLSDQAMFKKFHYQEKVIVNEMITVEKREISYQTLEHLNMLCYLTPSQVAYNIFKLVYKDNKRLNTKYDPSLIETIEQSFYGGLVVFGGIGEFKGRIDGKDVRSEYPLASTSPLPLLNDIYDYKKNLSKSHILLLNKKITEATKIRNNLFSQRRLHYPNEIGKIYEKIDFIGLFYCVVVPPSSENMSLISPLILATKSPNGNRKVNLFNIPFKKFFSTAHIKNFILFGWKIVIIQEENNIQFCYNKELNEFESCYQEKFCYMQKFIDFFNEKKANSTNKVMQKLFKFFMNVIFGRLAMRTDALSTEIIEVNSTTKGYSKKLDRIKGMDFNKSDKWLAVHINSNAHNIILEAVYLLELNQIYNQIPIHLREPVNLYIDTDSTYSFIMNSTSDVQYTISDALGKFNLKTFRFDVTWSNKHDPSVESVIIILFKKGYIITDSNYVIKDFKTKGVPSSDIKSKFYDAQGKLNSNIDLLYSNKTVGININRLTNKQNRDTLQKEFYNLNIVKNIVVDQLDKGEFDFSWKPAIKKSEKLNITHSPCNCCPYCLDWFEEIKKHKLYKF